MQIATAHSLAIRSATAGEGPEIVDLLSALVLCITISLLSTARWTISGEVPTLDVPSLCRADSYSEDEEDE